MLSNIFMMQHARGLNSGEKLGLESQHYNTKNQVHI